MGGRRNVDRLSIIEFVNGNENSADWIELVKFGSTPFMNFQEISESIFERGTGWILMIESITRTDHNELMEMILTHWREREERGGGKLKGRRQWTLSIDAHRRFCLFLELLHFLLFLLFGVCS